MCIPKDVHLGFIWDFNIAVGNVVILMFELNEGSSTPFGNRDVQPALALECVHPVLVVLLALGFPFLWLVLAGVPLCTVVHKARERCFLVMVSTLTTKSTVSWIIATECTLLIDTYMKRYFKQSQIDFARRSAFSWRAISLQISGDISTRAANDVTSLADIVSRNKSSVSSLRPSN